MIVYWFVILPAIYRRQIMMREVWALAGAEVIMLDAPIAGWMLMLLLRGVGFYG